jgi:hypothetical protein
MTQDPLDLRTLPGNLNCDPLECGVASCHPSARGRGPVVADGRLSNTHCVRRLGGWLSRVWHPGHLSAVIRLRSLRHYLNSFIGAVTNLSPQRISVAARGAVARTRGTHCHGTPRNQIRGIVHFERLRLHIMHRQYNCLTTHLRR